MDSHQRDRSSRHGQVCALTILLSKRHVHLYRRYNFGNPSPFPYLKLYVHSADHHSENHPATGRNRVHLSNARSRVVNTDDTWGHSTNKELLWHCQINVSYHIQQMNMQPMQLSTMQFLLSSLIIILVFQVSLKYFSKVFLCTGLICCCYTSHSLHDPSVGIDQSKKEWYFMISKNTSLMQLIRIYFTYSKSLLVSGRTLPIGLIPVAYMYSIIFS